MNIQLKSKASAVALSLMLAGNLTPAIAFADGADTASQATAIEAPAGDTGAAATGTANASAADTSAASTGNSAAKAPSNIKEPAADASTTAPNNVDTVVPSDDKQGSDISYKANMKVWGMEFPVADTTASITADDAKSDKTLSEVSSDFAGTEFGNVKAGDLVVKGDMAIKNDDGTYDTTKDAAHNVKKDSKHDVKADLDVTAIHTSIEKSGSLLSDTYGADAAKAVYVNNLETGLRATFSFGNNLNGEFYVPTTLEDAQAHYVLASADGHPLIFRINYGKSSFAKDKVIVAMDLDLTQITPQKTTYSGSNKTLYGTGEGNVMENFNHTDAEYGSTYDTSTFGNLEQLISSSANKISLTLKDVLFHSATGNATTTETNKETTTTTQGAINGTLVGYMKADVGHNSVKGNVSYAWGAMQDPAGTDVKATGDNVMTTVQFTEVTPKTKPDNPDKHDTDKPDKHHTDNPVKPSDNTSHQTNNNGSNATENHPVSNVQTVSAPVSSNEKAAQTHAAETKAIPALGDSSMLSVESLLTLMGVTAGVIAVALRRMLRKN
ncbi:MAG: hypothetical protein ACOX12_06800 [Eggerthellaceae bacterium]|jgi:hypothetical protein